MDNKLPMNPVTPVYEVRVFSEDIGNRVLYLEHIQMMDKRIKALEKQVAMLTEAITSSGSKGKG